MTKLLLLLKVSIHPPLKLPSHLGYHSQLDKLVSKLNRLITERLSGRCEDVLKTSQTTTGMQLFPKL